MTIHATAHIHPEATIGNDVTIGPNVVVDRHVSIGDGCTIWANAYITGHTTIGRDNQIHMGAVIGHVPQDKSFKDDVPTYLVIGDRNIIREYATIHRAAKPEGTTTIGSGGFFMAHSHIAHDCRVGDDVVVCNNSSAAGHVTIGDRAFISGNVVIHQFSRIGMLCMLGGGCQVGQDVPPYVTVAGRSQVRSLNVVGMRRAGFTPPIRAAVKDLYRRIFSDRTTYASVLDSLPRSECPVEIERIRAFYEHPTKRGFCWPPSDRTDISDDRDRGE